MSITDLTKADAENIQTILQYIRENGVIHKDQAPDALRFIPPAQYAGYRNVILAIDPAVVEYDPLSDNVGLPATEHLETYMDKGGFLHTYNAELIRVQQETQARQWARALQQQQENGGPAQPDLAAVSAGKSAGHRATIAMILAIIALLIEIIMLINK
ncbi:hypothetical protein [Niabella drilacis]|uniref:Uncharacterized protein n=1 Tax=Niabella drilacis (strain DSM 25811 / CCM 8410 / CCUG 62505 / LMG 26954 / E90) TaxID=1285928 RepID=A0A1G6IVC0_NIADE|nr:hypothetical protein [Niabella drilacis]SDC10414.1 hypothetical protein SAMN04487894_101338 [Niabella drilacis]